MCSIKGPFQLGKVVTNMTTHIFQILWFVLLWRLLGFKKKKQKEKKRKKKLILHLLHINDHYIVCFDSLQL